MRALWRLCVSLGLCSAGVPWESGRGPVQASLVSTPEHKISRLLSSKRVSFTEPELETSESLFFTTVRDDTPFMEVSYNEGLQPLVDVKFGGQWLKLVFDTSSGNTGVFVKEREACEPKDFPFCYSYKAAEALHTLKVCKENNEKKCISQGGGYECKEFQKSFEQADSHIDELSIDGVEYAQKSVEALETATLRLVSGQGSSAKSREVIWPGMPVRLMVEPSKPRVPTGSLSLDLFAYSSGIFGASGPTLSCRSETVWDKLIRQEKVNRFSLDLAPPPAAIIQEIGPSRIVLNEIDLSRGRQDIIWSEPKQTGDLLNDGMHEFLLYRLEACDTDLLYNVSSNWLVVLDTSGPCLTLPPFIFDRLRARVAMDCPFEFEEKALGRLCRPRRDASGGKLPMLHFGLADVGQPTPPRLWLPLERLVIKNSTGSELLCVSRDDSGHGMPIADMMFSHIAFGSLVLSAFYTVIDLENHTIGLSSKGDPDSEVSKDMCIRSRICKGSQVYFPPMNLCEDPACSAYMFMSLDEGTKTCQWSKLVPYGFAVLLVILVGLDLFSHRLYKQAIAKASGLNQ